MSKHVDTTYFCDFCGCVCNTRRIHIPGYSHTPAHLCVVTNNIVDQTVNYMFDICEKCVRKLARVPLQAKPKETNK